MATEVQISPEQLAAAKEAWKNFDTAVPDFELKTRLVGYVNGIFGWEQATGRGEPQEKKEREILQLKNRYIGDKATTEEMEANRPAIEKLLRDNPFLEGLTYQMLLDTTVENSKEVEEARKKIDTAKLAWQNFHKAIPDFKLEARLLGYIRGVMGWENDTKNSYGLEHKARVIKFLQQREPKERATIKEYQTNRLAIETLLKENPFLEGLTFQMLLETTSNFSEDSPDERAAIREAMQEGASNQEATRGSTALLYGDTPAPADATPQAEQPTAVSANALTQIKEKAGDKNGAAYDKAFEKFLKALDNYDLFLKLVGYTLEKFKWRLENFKTPLEKNIKKVQGELINRPDKNRASTAEYEARRQEIEELLSTPLLAGLKFADLLSTAYDYPAATPTRPETPAAKPVAEAPAETPVLETLETPELKLPKIPDKQEEEENIEALQLLLWYDIRTDRLEHTYYQRLFENLKEYVNRQKLKEGICAYLHINPGQAERYLKILTAEGKLKKKIFKDKLKWAGDKASQTTQEAEKLLLAEIAKQFGDLLEKTLTRYKNWKNNLNDDITPTVYLFALDIDSNKLSSLIYENFVKESFDDQNVRIYLKIIGIKPEEFVKYLPTQKQYARVLGLRRTLPQLNAIDLPYSPLWMPYCQYVTGQTDKKPILEDLLLNPQEPPLPRAAMEYVAKELNINLPAEAESIPLTATDQRTIKTPEAELIEQVKVRLLIHEVNKINGLLDRAKQPGFAARPNPTAINDKLAWLTDQVCSINRSLYRPEEEAVPAKTAQVKEKINWLAKQIKSLNKFLDLDTKGTYSGVYEQTGEVEDENKETQIFERPAAPEARPAVPLPPAPERSAATTAPIEAISNQVKIDEQLFGMAAEVVMAYTKTASVSLLQRMLDIGYNEAADIIAQMEKYGLVGPATAGAPRRVFPEKIYQVLAARRADVNKPTASEPPTVHSELASRGEPTPAAAVSPEARAGAAMPVPAPKKQVESTPELAPAPRVEATKPKIAPELNDKELLIIVRDYLSYLDTATAKEKTEPDFNYPHTREYAQTLGELLATDETLAQTRTGEIRQNYNNVTSAFEKILKLKPGDFSSRFGKSKTFIYWDIAKQKYIFSHQDDKSNNPANRPYHLGDPLTDDRVAEDIVDRHFGWEARMSGVDKTNFSLILDALDYSKPGADEIRQLLLADSDSTLNKNAGLNSYDLARLGKLLREHFNLPNYYWQQRPPTTEQPHSITAEAEAAEPPKTETVDQKQFKENLKYLEEHLDEYCEAVWNVYKSPRAIEEAKNFTPQERADIDALVKDILLHYIADRKQGKNEVTASVRTYGQDGYARYLITEDVDVRESNAKQLAKIPAAFDACIKSPGEKSVIQIVPLKEGGVTIRLVYLSGTGKERNSWQTQIITLPNNSQLEKYFQNNINVFPPMRALRHALTVINPAAHRLLDYGVVDSGSKKVAVIDFDSLVINEDTARMPFTKLESFIKTIKDKGLGGEAKRGDMRDAVYDFPLLGGSKITGSKDAAPANELRQLVEKLVKKGGAKAAPRVEATPKAAPAPSVVSKEEKAAIRAAMEEPASPEATPLVEPVIDANARRLLDYFLVDNWSVSADQIARDLLYNHYLRGQSKDDCIITAKILAKQPSWQKYLTEQRVDLNMLNQMLPTKEDYARVEALTKAEKSDNTSDRKLLDIMTDYLGQRGSRVANEAVGFMRANRGDLSAELLQVACYIISQTQGK